MNAATEAIAEALYKHEFPDLQRDEWEPPEAYDDYRAVNDDHAAVAVDALREAISRDPSVLVALGMEQVGVRRSYGDNGGWGLVPERVVWPGDRPVFAVLPVEENKDG